jgi:uncharacterized HAD superfamily protein/orotate phosphoribosyltransferase
MKSIEYRSFIDLTNQISTFLSYNNLYEFDLILGVPKSGMFPAYILGSFLNKPVLDIYSFIDLKKPVGGSRSIDFCFNSLKKVLIVDDSIRTGSELKNIKKLISGVSNLDFKYFVVYATRDNKNSIDFFCELIDGLRIFQWNILNSWIYEYSCVDIDGVLCEDPSDEENDDGENYRKFLINANVKYLPRYKIDILVTNRLEKYRTETVEWLDKNKIQYNKLIMLDLPDKETRIKLGIHAKYKSEIYSNNNKNILFIESSYNQAKEINLITGLPVFSVEKMTFFPKKNIFKNNLFNKLKKITTFTKVNLSCLLN